MFGKRVKEERDRYRAILEGADYPNLDNLSKFTPAQCREIGEEVKRRTEAYIDEVHWLRARVRELEQNRLTY